MAACVENNITEIIPTPEESVVFAARLNNNLTRTLYGEENSAGTGVKVNWVHNDLIEVFGTTCLEGRQQAQYSVGTVKIDENNEPVLDDNGKEQPVSGQNYANYLLKKDEIGVQWGNEDASDFYAFYPSVSNTTITPSKSNNVVSSVTINTAIESTQHNVFSKDASGNWVGVPYLSDMNNPTMPNALMYAYTGNAKSGQTVDLRFKPYSTVLNFKFAGWTTTNNLSEPTVYVQKITLTAPEGTQIAGDFTLEVTPNADKKDATAGVVDGSISNATNIIEILPNYLALEKGKTVEFNVFVIPHNLTLATTTPWKVTLETQHHGSFTYKLIPTLGESPTAEQLKKATLLAGNIHKVKVPLLTVKSSESVEPDKWIEYIPRNVYLTELSVPGAWYCTEAEYQGSIGFGTKETITVTDSEGNVLATEEVDKGLNTLYNTGIRAFHIDCRLTNKTNSQDLTNPLSTMDLICAGTDKSGTLGLSYEPGDLVKTKIQDLAKILRINAKTKNYEEYIVVVLTIAEKPLTRSGDNNIFGTIDPEYVLPAINTMITALIKDGYPIYNSKITKDTTVDDVLGNIVVVVNAPTPSTTFVTYTNSSYLMFESSLWTGNTTYDLGTSGNILNGVFDTMLTKSMYWGSETTDLMCYYHVGQKTASDGGWYEQEIDHWDGWTPVYKDVFYPYAGTNVPTYEERKTAVTNIISESASIYSTKAHNGWYQIAIGGYRRNINSTSGSEEDANHEAIAQEMNPFMLQQVNAKLASTPSPVGVVLMNFATDDATNGTNGKGAALVKAILEMNTKFRLDRNPDAEEWPEGKPYEDATAAQETAAYVTVKGDAF